MLLSRSKSSHLCICISGELDSFFNSCCVLPVLIRDCLMKTPNRLHERQSFTEKVPRASACRCLIAVRNHVPARPLPVADDRTDGSTMRIAMLGTRGVPARYGGFETAVEEVGRRLADRGHRVVVYCRTARAETDRPARHLGMELVHLPAAHKRALETLSRPSTIVDLRDYPQPAPGPRPVAG